MGEQAERDGQSDHKHTKEHGHQKSRQKQAFYKKLQEGGKASMRDWVEEHRIPPKERQLICNRYYMLQLRRRVRSQASIVTVAKRMLESQRELDGFLKEFGATTTEAAYWLDSEVLQNEVAPPPFWQVTEEMVLSLIALAAQAKGPTPPFRDHPANRELSDNPMYRKPYHDAQTIVLIGVQQETERLDDLLCQVNRVVMRPSELERPVAHVVKQQPLAARQQASKQEGMRDLEDIFDCFTPRLREISDKQSVEYRMDDPARATTPTGGV